MKETKFTPGPWSIDKVDIKEDNEGCRHGFIYIGSQRWGEFCSIARHLHNEDDSIAEANSRLVCAAPDMYKLLKETALFMDSNNIGHTIEIWKLLNRIKG